MPRLDHINILTSDAPVMIGFLEAVLLVKEGYRPPFSVPGHWLYLEDRPVIHLNRIERSYDFEPGMLDHFAFGLYDFEPAMQRVEASGYRYEHCQIPDTDIDQIFVYGPEGLKIELQCPRPV